MVKVAVTTHTLGIKNAVLRWLFKDAEYAFILGFLTKLHHSGKLGLVGDFACGKGRYLYPLKDRGVEAIGFDINPAFCSELARDGIEVRSPDEINEFHDKFDCLILSHIIEHFAPQKLQALLNEALTTLKVGGHLIIATPLMSPWFYDDYDHVRPYHPASITQILDPRRDEFEYQTQARFYEEHIWIQRRPLRLVHWGHLYESGQLKKLGLVYDIFMAIAFKVSFGLIGRPYTWVGIFRRVK